MEYEKIVSLLKEKNQEQLLDYYEELSLTSQEHLLGTISSIDFTLLQALENPETDHQRGKIEPLGALRIDEIEEQKEVFEKAGVDAIIQGKIGAILLAGGQGTRLGYDKPKGTYNIGESKDLYIFECLVQNLMDVVNQTETWIPLAIMTSDINYEDTVDFFKDNKYFGYNADYIYFFVQEMAPATDYEGKIYLQEKGYPAMSPNGNGGWFTSFVNAGLLNEFSKLGVEWMNVFAVDNVLQRIADPCFVGATVLSGCVSSAKVVSKATPEEKVGLL